MLPVPPRATLHTSHVLKMMIPWMQVVAHKSASQVDWTDLQMRSANYTLRNTGGASTFEYAWDNLTFHLLSQHN